MRFDALIAGGFAGFAVDVSLFPLDTLKTRAQSQEGFFKAGGFKGVYKGLGPAALGSFPGAALFFMSYEMSKPKIAASLGYKEANSSSLVHMTAGAMGETVACLIRVPTENVKQNLQTGRYKTAIDGIRSIISQRGLLGFYTGYGTTLMREIPFSMIQFPIWEGMKTLVKEFQNQEPCTPLQSAVFGSLSGGFAAALTTPLDVMKTRIMTSPEKYQGLLRTFNLISKEEGTKAFFKGIEPRVMWISIGGFVFFGAYESALKAVGLVI